jgi:hypothetical protein
MRPLSEGQRNKQVQAAAGSPLSLRSLRALRLLSFRAVPDLIRSAYEA